MNHIKYSEYFLYLELFHIINQLPRGKLTRSSKKTNLTHLDAQPFNILRIGSGGIRHSMKD